MPNYLDARLGVRLSEAIAESMASNTIGDPILLTLEIQNPNFIDENGAPTSVWIVNDHEPLVAFDENAVERTFVPVPFRYSKPEQTATGAPAALQIEVDNVAQTLTGQLMLAGRSTTYVIEREYLPSDLTAPHVLPPTRLVLSAVRVTSTSVQAQASFGDFTNRRFPFNIYTRERFACLAAQG